MSTGHPHPTSFSKKRKRKVNFRNRRHLFVGEGFKVGGHSSPLRNIVTSAEEYPGAVSGIYIFFSGFYIQFEIGFLYNVGIIFKEDFYGLSQASQQFPFSYVYYYL